MIDARIVFLLLTALMLAILVGIAVATLRRNRKQKLEEPKYRMLDED
jgi:cbb3-type cytochrome oxidase subunit 3